MLSSCSRLVWILVFASVVRVPKSWPDSLSLNFTVSTTEVDPSWMRWITVDLCSLWCSFFFLSFLFLLCLCWLAYCFACFSASGWFSGSWFPRCWSLLGWTSLFGGIFVWVSWVEPATQFVSGGVETSGSGFWQRFWIRRWWWRWRVVWCNWFGWDVFSQRGSSTFGGELAGSSDTRLSIT